MPGQPFRSGSGGTLHRGLLLVAIASSILASCSNRQSSASVVTDIRQLKSLSPSVEPHPRPVRISGPVTYWDTDWRLAFIQDSTGGLKVPTSAFAQRPPRRGELVSIDAAVGAGGEWPMLLNPSVRFTGKTPALRPPTIHLSDLSGRQHECELVRVEGIIQSAEVGRAGRYRLKLATPDGELSGWVADALGRDLGFLVDANVAITGVVSRSSDNGEARSARVWIQTADDLDMLTPAPNPYTIPIRPVSELLEVQDPLPLHRVHLRGKLHFDERSDGWILTDSSGAINVTLAAGGASAGAGERDVFGFLQRKGAEIVILGADSRKGQAASAKGVVELLRTARQVHELPPDEAAEGCPVHLRAVVTFYDRVSNLLFVQDSTGGIYVPPQKLPIAGLHPGDLVDVEGLSGPGEYAPVVMSPRVRVVGRAPLPRPADAPAEEIFTGTQDGNWVTLEAVVTAVHVYEERPFVNVVYGQHTALVLMPAGTKVPANLVESRVRVEGVCGAQFNMRRQLVGINLYAPRAEDLVVLKKSPMKQPVTPIVQTSQYSSDPSWYGARVQGIVTRTHPSGPTFIQDSSGGMLLQNHPGIVLQPGDRVRASGTVIHGEYGPFLHDAEVVRLGTGPKLRAPLIAADEILEGSHNAELVQVEGTLTGIMAGIHGLGLVMQSRGVMFTAELDGVSQTQDLDAGTVLRLTGVCKIGEDPSSRSLPDQFELLLQGPDSLEVMSHAPWWNARRTLILSGSLAFLILLSTLWVFMLRRRMGQQTLLIQSKHEREAQLEAQLAHASKLESIGRLAGGVAHDFNNLLTVINGYSDLLLMQTKPGMESFHSRLEEIRRAGSRAAELTHQLLVFSRKQVSQPRPIDLNELLLENREMIQRLLGEDVALITHLAPDLGRVTADPGQMHQVLMNLAANARDAMPHGGQLRIETSNVELDAVFVENHPEVAPGPHVLLTAADTGFGMDENTRRHLFEPFFTTKASDRGTGLGLATVYGIVSQSFGCIEVLSAPGEGSVFHIYLPRTSAADSAGEAGNAESSASDGSGTILVVEDQEAVRKVVVETLSSRGYHLLEASDGPSALKIAGRPGTHVDLLLTDVTMPGMTGRQLADRMRILRTRLKVIFMSGHSYDILSRDGVLDPGIEFLQKPFSPQSLLIKVRELLSEPEE